MSADKHEPPTSNPVGVDPSRASVARVYDALLGGKDNYEIDRQAVAEIEASTPDVATIAWDNRAWLGRVTRFLARTARVDQFLDCGSGLPTSENTHQIVARLNPGSVTAYVDHDPVVIAHGEALLNSHDQSFFVSADLGKPDDVLHHPSVADTIDFDRPVALLQVATLHHLPADYDTRAIMHRYVDALPSGSYVALSHIADPADGSELEHAAHELSRVALASAANTGRLRTPEEITELFGECELVEPGLVPLAEWWPDGPLTEPLSNTQRLLLGAVARKP